MTGARPSGRFPTLLLLVAALGACDPSTPGDQPDTPSVGDAPGLTLTDADGRTVHLDGPARRIVSLVPSATLTLDALGAGDRLVARTDHDTASWTQDLPSVGGGLQPSLESVVAVQPDLVIRFGGPQDTRTPRSLDDLGIAHVAIRPDRVQDVLSVIDLLGSATGSDAEAKRLVARIQAGLDSVRTAAAGLPTVRAAYVLGGDPPWVAGPDTYIDQLLALSGGENVFSDLGSLYAAVSKEEFLARRIDVILTPSPQRLDADLRSAARVEGSGDALELPGPGVVEAAWEVLRLLHPEAGR